MGKIYTRQSRVASKPEDLALWRKVAEGDFARGGRSGVVVSENCYMAPDEGSIKILFVGRLPEDPHRVTRKIGIGWNTAR